MPCVDCPNCQQPIQGEGPCPNCGFTAESEPTVAFVPVVEGHPRLTPEEASRVAGFSGYALVVERGPRAGMTFVLRPGTTTVGRHPENDIFLDDITVSRQHCRFMWDGGEMSVEDSGSTNGTYVNQARVDRSSLQPGDEVLVGRFHLIVALGDA